MLLSVIHAIILEMRRSWARWASSATRTTEMLLDVGLSRADVLYPTLAVSIRADAVSMRTMLEVAADAMINEQSFEASRKAIAAGLVLSAPILGFLEAALTVSLT